MAFRPRELPGRDVFESFQKFEWRFETLETDYERLQEVDNPEPDNTVSQHRYTVRSGLHDAERQLHHFLSGLYTLKSLTTTIAEDAPDQEFGGRVKDRRDEFAQNESVRVMLGLRHYVQHHNILPLLIRISAFERSGPQYVINKRELRLDSFEYREPQMVRDVEEFDDWFDYYYEGVDGICIFPFEQAESCWVEIEELRDDVYELGRTHLDEEIDEYVEQLSELQDVRQRLRDEHEEMDELLSNNEITPELEELLQPVIHERLVDDGDRVDDL